MSDSTASMMKSVSDYFHTDWAAMTFHDWLGFIITIIVFISMFAVYLYVFNPANREELESRRYIPLDEDNINVGDKR